jgi:hypothetical protein
MNILEEDSKEGVITWLTNGHRFFIHDKKRFMEEVMPKHFKKRSKLSSFTRKLN